MTYYKIILNNQIIAVATSDNFRLLKNNTLLKCSQSRGQFLYVDNKLYRDEWMNIIQENTPYISAIVQPIQENEYKILYNSIHISNIIIEEQENYSQMPTHEVVSSIVIPEYQDLNAEQLLVFVKERKLKELSYICNQTIEHGFDIQLLDGKIHHFSLTTQDQLNLITLSQMAANGTEQIPYHADGELCKFYTPVEIQMIIAEATRFKTYHTTYYNALKNYVNSLDDPYVIADIQYGIELPEEYQSDVLKTLHD